MSGDDRAEHVHEITERVHEITKRVHEITERVHELRDHVHSISSSVHGDPSVAHTQAMLRSRRPKAVPREFADLQQVANARESRRDHAPRARRLRPPSSEGSLPQTALLYRVNMVSVGVDEAYGAARRPYFLIARASAWRVRPSASAARLTCHWWRSSSASRRAFSSVSLSLGLGGGAWEGRATLV